MPYALEVAITFTLLLLTSLPLHPYVCDTMAEHLPVWEPAARGIGGALVGSSVLFAVYGITQASPTAGALVLWAGGGIGAAWAIETYLT